MMTKHHTHQSGFTLLELLLVVGVSATLLLGMVKVSDMWIAAMKAEQAGQHIEMIRRAADEYLHSQNPDDLIAAAATMGGDITGNSAFTDFLPNREDSLVSPLGINRTTNVRLVYNISTGTPKFEVFINTIGAPIPNKLLVAAANAVGAFGGMISRIFPGGTSARSPYGTWEFPTAASFLVDPSDVDDDGGQLAVYYAVTSQDIFGPYLYRMEVDSGNPTYNTMLADLLMNGNSIVGANEIHSTVLNVANDATIDGLLTGNNATFAGDLTVGGAAFTIAGNARIDGTLDVENNATIAGMAGVDRLAAITATTGTINVGEVDVATLNVSSTANLQVDNLTVNTALSGMTIGGTLYSRNVSSDTVRVADDLYTQNLSVIDGGVNIDGDVTLSGGTVKSEDMVINRCLTLNGIQYGACP